MLVINTVDELKKEISKLKKNGFSIGFVPTMGALHKGHASLIENSVQKADKTVVSIFLNPIQFCKNEDLDKYPKTLEKDIQICKKYKVDILFAPPSTEIYPQGMQNITKIIPAKTLTNKLCGLARKGHFEGVATVVAKLFNIVEPDYSFFGKKDAQQLAIIKQMVKDLNFTTKIVGCEIVREDEGLAMSSRNSYLSTEERKKATCISKALFAIENQYKSGITDICEAQKTVKDNLNNSFNLEYLEFVDADTLNKVKTLQPNTLIAIAGKINNTRLIDNIIL